MNVFDFFDFASRRCDFQNFRVVPSFDGRSTEIGNTDAGSAKWTAPCGMRAVAKFRGLDHQPWQYRCPEHTALLDSRVTVIPIFDLRSEMLASTVLLGAVLLGPALLLAPLSLGLYWLARLILG